VARHLLHRSPIQVRRRSCGAGAWIWALRPRSRQIFQAAAGLSQVIAGAGQTFGPSSALPALQDWLQARGLEPGPLFCSVLKSVQRRAAVLLHVPYTSPVGLNDGPRGERRPTWGARPKWASLK
jgi:hypothetical protein